MNTFEFRLLTALTLFVSLVHIQLFTFRYTEDSPCWERVVDFLSGKTPAVTPHCLYNPAVPLLASLFATPLHLSLQGGYELLNVFSLLGSAVMLFHIAGYFFPRPYIPLLTATLFLLDYNPQRYGFAFMPDAFTWLLISFTIWLIIQFHTQRQITFPQILASGLWGSVALLSKMNLAFLLMALILVCLKRHYLLKTLILGTAMAIPVIVFYAYAYTITHVLPWGLLNSGSNPEAVTVTSHVLAFITAYLYLLIPLGMGILSWQHLKHRPLFILIGVALLVPIIIWPYVTPRFAFTLFPLLLPLSAIGFYQLSQKISPKHSLVVLSFLLVGFFGLSTLRIHLTLTQQSHLQFISHMLSSSSR